MSDFLRNGGVPVFDLDDEATKRFFVQVSRLMDHEARSEPGMNENTDNRDQSTSVDPREPDMSRAGRQGGNFFVHHNCYRCKNGSLPCVMPGRVCHYPVARDD